ncbi:NADPH-dependent glutamate synthase [Bdellovibrionota bacterium FG-2]
MTENINNDNKPKLTAKERMALPRAQMPERDATIRSRCFEEVNMGLTEEMAVLEAQRCLKCKNRQCVEGCPVRVSIPEFISALANGNIADAVKVLRKDTALPAVCGRVCPQETQCEEKCIRGVKAKPVAIGYLERFVADWAMNHPAETHETLSVKPTGKTVAIVGCGPAGLTAAGELARLGHKVSIFEALHDTGGVLRYGIPEFRLPKEIIDKEVAHLSELGVAIECNVIIGKTMTLQELRDDYYAVFIANGAGLPMMLNIPGENLKGVYSANEFLTRVNLMGAGQVAESTTPIIQGDNVAVIGAGNTAMDCVRTARRLGAKRAMIIYRRTEAEMPARKEEIHHAKEEGIEFVLLTAPLGVVGNSENWATGLRCQKMALGEPDASGRRKPVAIEGAFEELPVNVVINALGTRANPLLTQTAPDLKLNKWGNIAIDENTTATSLKGVFAGGDIVRGGATVILAMGDGKKAAGAIHEYLCGLGK